MREVLESNLGEIDVALRSFVGEMKAHRRWKDVAVISTSEFGRTITSNGLGTDHGETSSATACLAQSIFSVE